MADFGTSQKVGDETNMRLNARDTLMTNYAKFMTPLYASPAIVKRHSKINQYVEDVFSLGVTFL